MKKHHITSKLATILSAVLIATSVAPSAGILEAKAAGNGNVVEARLQTFTAGNNLPSNDELLEGYIYSHGSNLKTYSISPSYGSRSDQFTGLSKAVYDRLKENITQIAKGEKASSEITFSFIGKNSLETIMGSAYKQTYTAADLGLNNLNNDEAIENALIKLTGYEFSTVLNALLYDLPYELYWFDKKSGATAYKSVNYRRATTSVTLNPRLEFTFYVSKDYSKTGNIKTADLDTSLINKVNSAITNANKIVEDNSSASDINKLKAYKSSICELTDYNKQAAGEGVNYGDPWQIISIFDSDPNTNVVCEGYSKAFKYLCDKTSFNSNKIECRTVTGTMNGGTGAGDHMWNIVTMDDGKNYIVDVTNCDTGSIGSPDKLFLTGASKSGTKITANKAKVTYIYDSDTNNMYSTAELTIATNNYGEAAPDTGSDTDKDKDKDKDSDTDKDKDKDKETDNTDKDKDKEKEDEKEKEPEKQYVIVSFDPAGGAVNTSSLKLVVGEAYGTLPTPTKSGYTFTGWTLGGSKINSSTKVTLATPHTLTATWVGNAIAVKVLDGDGYSYLRRVGDKYGDIVSGTMSKTGYTFTGWYLDKELTQKVTSESLITSPGDHDIYPGFKANSYSVKLDTTINGLDVLSTRTVEYGSKYGFLPTLTMDSYTFGGWYLSKNYNDSEKVTASTICKTAKDHTLYAKMTAKSSGSSSSGSGSSGSSGSGSSSSGSGSSGGNKKSDPKKIDIKIKKGSKINTKTTDVTATTSSGSKATAAIFKVTGSNTLEYLKPANSKAKTVIIPSSLKINGKKYNVTTIDGKAFRNNTYVKKVEIPKTVKKIEAGAFKNAKKLTKINSYAISFKSIGNGAFDSLSKKTVFTFYTGSRTKCIAAVKKVLKSSPSTAVCTFMYVEP